MEQTTDKPKKQMGGVRPGAGRPVGNHTLKASLMRQKLIEEADKYWPEIVQAVIRNARRGDIQTLKELNDRIFGKSSQPIELTGENGGPIKQQITGMQIVPEKPDAPT